jgi:hypothetical protein
MCRSIEDGAESTLTTVCAAANVVGNISVTYDACHYNDQPSNLRLNRPATGIQAPRGAGIAGVVLAGVLLVAFSTVSYHRDAIADRLCPQPSPGQILPESTTNTDDPPLNDCLNDSTSQAAIDMSAVSNGDSRPEAAPPAAMVTPGRVPQAVCPRLT